MTEPATSVPLIGGLIDQAAHVESVLQDLSFASRALDELKGRPVRPIASQPIDEVDTIAVALWNAAVVAYGRCFNQGPRAAVARQLIPTNPEFLKAHRELTDLRGDHIAHLVRDSDHERLSARLDIGQTNANELAIRLDLEGNKILLPSPAEVRTYRALIRTVESRAAELKSETYEHIGARLKELGGEEIRRAAKAGRAIRLEVGRPLSDSSA